LGDVTGSEGRFWFEKEDPAVCALSRNFQHSVCDWSMRE